MDWKEYEETAIRVDRVGVVELPRSKIYVSSTSAERASSR